MNQDETNEKTLKSNTGRISQIIGAVVNVEFSSGNLPKIYDALTVENPKSEARNPKQSDNDKQYAISDKLVLEVQQHLGGNEVKTVAMSTTDGLKRGMDIVSTGEPISVGVGKETLGRIFNVTGEAIDNLTTPKTTKKSPIHRPAPKFDELKTEVEILETGIKVIDLICPISKGGKVGMFGGAGVGKTVVI